MAVRPIGVDELWDMVLGGAALATGGGGVAPTREEFDAQVGPALESGLKPALVPASEVPEEGLVYMGVGVGGGVRREEKEVWLANPGWDARSRPGFDHARWIDARLQENEWLYPSCTWSERPAADPMGLAERRLEEIVGEPSVADITFEIGPRVYATLLRSAGRGRPVVDADTAGYRAVPEVSLSSLNVAEVPITPAVLVTAWGDLLVLEKVLNWQRYEDLARHVAVSCGGGVSGMAAFRGDAIERGAVQGSISKAIEVGRAIREAVDAGRDPTSAAAQAAGGHILFRGRVLAQLNEDKGAFIWGDERLEGTGEFAGHAFRVWYKNENHMTWLDGRPYVMSPDLVTVLDARTGRGLSNFAASDWTWGREVAVLGVPCAPVWRTERGARIFNPLRWGFACEYVPIDRAMR